MSAKILRPAPSGSNPAKGDDCPHCNEGKLSVSNTGAYGTHDPHLICPKCYSTYVLDEDLPSDATVRIVTLTVTFVVVLLIVIFALSWISDILLNEAG